MISARTKSSTSTMRGLGQMRRTKSKELIKEEVIARQNNIIDREIRPDTADSVGTRKTMRKYPL